MGKFEFEVNELLVPCLSVTVSGLSFNQSFIDLLGNPRKICIGIDREDKRLAIKAYEDDDKNKHAYIFNKNDQKRKKVIVNDIKICEEVCKMLDLEQIDSYKNFVARYDEKSKMFIVDLSAAFD